MMSLAVLGRRGILLAWSLSVLLPACRGAETEQTELTLAAAASLRRVMPDLIAAHRPAAPVKIRVVYGASGDLRKRVIDGAPVDAVLFANAVSVDSLLRADMLVASTRHVFATNELVLIGPTGGAPLRWETLDQLPAGERLSIGDPRSVPAGLYAREALQKLGKWASLKGRIVFGGSVSGVLAHVRRGEVAAGIVYGTEIRGVGGLKVFDTARGAWAPRAEVVGGVVRGGQAVEQATAFMNFTVSEAGKAIWVKHGFGRP